ncbi:MAG: cysteine synthase family protein [Deltaproteobacteria bacterium]|nr:cysteine synthase family protein [Deltaproteobacteria bacterium]
MVFKNVLAAIGRTPVIELQRIPKGTDCRIWVKFEGVNINGSIKSRTALGVIEAAEKSGRLTPGGGVVEATTGNMGIALAMICAVKGYHCTICMPEKFGVERRKLIKAYGGTLHVTPLKPTMKEMIGLARQMCEELEKSDPHKYVYLKQFDNAANPDIHRRTTAAEIMADTKGEFDTFVATIGTGGTLTGVAEVLKASIAGLKVFGVEPHAAALEGQGRADVHKQQGIGDGQRSKVLNRTIMDGWLAVHDDEAYRMTRRLAQEEGIFAGISSGSAVCAAIQAAKNAGPGHTILTILPDTGERYMLDELWADLDDDKG